MIEIFEVLEIWEFPLSKPNYLFVMWPKREYRVKFGQKSISNKSIVVSLTVVLLFFVIFFFIFC